LRRGLLIIDRGSREQEAKDELNLISAAVKEKGGYQYCSYCFLEVIPPFIDRGISDALEHKLDELVIVPYFLYPGKKVKAAVSDAMSMQAGTDTKFLVTRPMSMHRTMIDLVRNRVASALQDSGRTASESQTDVLIIGHGSVDPNAQISIQYVVDGLRPLYRNISHCFLEIEQPDIRAGLQACKNNNPDTLVIVFYFLHEGAHVKRDIYEDLRPALNKLGLEPNAVVTKHIGADSMMIDLILERASEVQSAD